MSESETRNPVDVYDYLGFVLQSLAELGWSKLGLQPDMSTGQIEPPDLEQAKAAIDAADAVAQVVLGRLDDGDRRQLQNVLRDLRVNYVERAKA